jgi:hypothetical protein
MSNSTSTPPRIPEPDFTKIDALTTYGVGFGFYIWLELEFHRASNGTGPTSKFLLNRRESSTQVDVQNLSGCCVTVILLVFHFHFRECSRRVHNLLPSFLFCLTMIGKEPMDETSPSTPPDDNECMSHMELKDMMRAMTDAFNKH